MKKGLLIITFIFFVASLMAQPALNKEVASQKEFPLQPVYCIELQTTEGNVLKGLFLQAYDSFLVVYPGKWKEWNRNKTYRPVMFNYTQIKSIMLKRTDKPRERMISVMATAPDQRSKINTADTIEFHKTTVTINGDPQEISCIINGDMSLFTAYKKQLQ